MFTPAAPAALNSRASSPGRSAMTTWTTAEVPRLPAVLAGDARDPGPAPVEQAGHVASRGALVSPASSRAAARQVLGHGRDHLGDRAGVGGQDLGPQRAVAGRDPGDVAQALPGQPERVGRDRRGASRAAIATATRCGACETSATQRSWVSGSVVTGTAPHATASAVTAADRVGAVSGSGHSAQVRPRNRSAWAAAGPCRSRPASGCDGHVRLQVAAELPRLRHRQRLHAGDVGVHSATAHSCA